MLTGTQTLPKVVLPSKALEISSMPQFLDNSKLLQTRILQPAVLPIYAESDYQWLVGVLDKLVEFMRCDENHNVPELTESDYDWAHALLVKLVGAVGESETHPLHPLMEFVIRLIDNYEDAYVPKLTELFPELASETPIGSEVEKKQPIGSTPKLSDIELAAHAFFSIGYLLYHGNRTEKAISAYDKVIELNQNFTSAYYNRGILKSELKDYEGAIADFDKTIMLGFNSADVYCYRAAAKAFLGEHENAVSDYDKVIALKPDCVEAYNIRGILRSELGRHEEALADYTEAIRIKPDYAEAYAYRGGLEAHLGRINKAKSDFQKALELAKRPSNNSLKDFVKSQLQQLSRSASKQSNKKPRYGGEKKRGNQEI